MVHIEYLQKPYDPMVFLRTAADANHQEGGGISTILMVMSGHETS
jgi:hypothetical protein